MIIAALLALAPAGTPITVIGTSDTHGRIERLAVLAADVDVIRAEAKKAGGAAIWVDGGDLFQGTLESNLVEGKSVIDALNIAKPDAVAVGNHEFDYGPVGPGSIPKKPGDDPRGALKQRMKDAQFPFLAANIVDEATGKPLAGAKSSVTVTAAGVKIGIIGVATMDTPHTTTATNFKGLKMVPLLDAISSEAAVLRKAGADVVVVAAHAGGACTKVDDPADTSSCEKDAEIFTLARALPAGTVDVIVAGHTHNQIAAVVNGIPIIESWANGKGFGRVDLDVDTKAKKVTLVKVHPPQEECVDDKAPACAPADVDGTKITANAKVVAAIAPYVDAAKREKDRKIGTALKHDLKRAYDQESALGNVFADAMLEAAHDLGWKADIAIMNGGGIRANLPAGDVTYGQIFEMMPFDNRYATITTTGKVVREWLEQNLSAKKGGILSVSGVIADVTCDGKAHATLKRKDGTAIKDDDKVIVVTTDFLATGGESTKLPPESILLDDGDPIREHVARALAKHHPTLDADDVAWFDPAHRRLNPGRCKP